MRIHIIGRHAHRTPFAYEAYKPLFQTKFEYVDDAKNADVILFGYVLNIDENEEELAKLLEKKPNIRLVVASEEPLWDTTNSGDFRKRHNTRKTKSHSFSYSVINHHTSNAYEFIRFPYFLTTENEYFLRYAHEFSANVQKSAEEILRNWGSAKTKYTFFAENRDLVKKYSVSHPDIETYGLSVYRTDVAKAMPDNQSMRVGQGWGAKQTRQSLPDWHLDKIQHLQDRSYIISAIENTNQRNYISEKIFDAFACTGVPLYWCTASHRVHELVDGNSFINLYDLTPEKASQKVKLFKPNAAYLESYRQAQADLSALFRNYDEFVDERIQFFKRFSAELETIVKERSTEVV
ncbi:hypothetical protein PRI8871_03648 [Pseudoprimorskyibacter insulae]|uniref:Fucosyltransferase C-terminal domain-containing protein n=2 Tax=Pseudoprimorskyibacter insulae TaxID=1695997 RepID=A0A2R8B0L0_9RHOB|nr:hypothetical protein PRI8871_03648 [Pseudoprimorskyibacter insulae]